MTNENNNQTTNTENNTDKKNSWLSKYSDLNINKKISLLVTLISFCAIIVIGIISFYSSKNSLKNVGLDQLNSITEIKKRSLEDFFELARNQIKVFAQDQMVIEAMAEFNTSFQNVEADAYSIYSANDFENMTANVKNFYNTSFITPLNNNLNTNTTVDSYWSDNTRTTYLQYIYISNNPNPIESKSLLSKTADGSSYGYTHGKYHLNIRDFAEKFGYEDIYFIDERDGNIIYSVSKKVDFGTNLLTGPFKSSGLALAYEVIKNSNVKDYNFLTDMKFYNPSLGAPSCFISAPVFNDKERIGIIVFQISGKKINNIVTGNKQWLKDGLGKTGETYLVGDDHLMRSDCRMIFENKNEYLNIIRFMGIIDEEIGRINTLNTSILTQKIETEAADEAINGRSGEKIIKNYLNQKVLSAYAPLDIQDVNWGIISEIQTNEIFLPIKSLRNNIILLVIILLVIIYFSANYLSDIIARRIINIKDSINKMAAGESIHTIDNNSSDEIGLTAMAVNQLVERLEEISGFANAIGKGDFSYDYRASSVNDKLGNSLIEMKKSLEEARQEEEKRVIEDEKRNWATQGIAKFGEILRSNNDNLALLSYDIISNLVDYLKANQGGLFLLEGEDENDAHINLMASYAYNRQKFIKKRVEIGEGLIGTCMLEKKTIHLTEIPEDYINITSGLGDANPNAILIVPLKTEDNVLGVIEIATFEKFEAHEIEFVEKLADSIASTVTSVKINAKTAKLLKESNEKANTLSQQEEEMRQNLEELKATQEEMERIKKEEVQKEEERKVAEQKFLDQMKKQNEEMKAQSEELMKEKALLDAILDYLPASVYFKDKASKFIRVSKSMIKLFKAKSYDEIIGKSDFDFQGKEHAQAAYDDEQKIIQTGEPIIDLVEKEAFDDGRVNYVSTTKLPFKDKQGNIIGTFGISTNITHVKELEEEIEQKKKEIEEVHEAKEQLSKLIETKKDLNKLRKSKGK